MTALSWDLDPADVAVLDVLAGISNIHTHVGEASDTDGDAKTVGAALPYLLYGSGLGFATSQRLGGHRGRVLRFSLQYVHGSFEGAKAVALAVRDHLDGHPVTIDGRARRIRLDDPTDDVVIVRDQTWTRPGGGALFYGTDRFWVEAGSPSTAPPTYYGGY